LGLLEEDKLSEEKAKIVAWLRRRAKMCQEDKLWYTPIKNRKLSAMSGTFNASAILIEADVHYAIGLDDETDLIKSLIQS
jgi:hypothetical protein